MRPRRLLLPVLVACACLPAPLRGEERREPTPEDKAALAAAEKEQRRQHDEAVKQAIDDFKKGLREAKNIADRVALVKKLSDAERDPKIQAEIARLLSDPAESVRIEAMQAVGRYRRDKAASGALAAAFPLNSRTASMLSHAIAAFGDVGHESAVPLVVRYVSDKDDKVAAAAIRALGEMNSPAAVPALIEAWERLEKDKTKGDEQKKAAEERLKAVEGPLKESLAALTGQKQSAVADYRAWWNENRASLRPKEEPPAPVCPHLAPLAWVSPEGLVGYWPFDDGKGNPSAADCSGNGHHAAYLGAPMSVSQVPPPLAPFSSHALRLDGSNDWVAVRSAPALQIPGDLTVAFWFRKEGEADDWVRLVGRGGEKVRPFGVFLEKAPSSRLKFQQYGNDGKGVLDVDSRSSAPAGAWVHVAAVVKGDRGFLYVNGALEGAKGRTGTAAATEDPFTIGYGGFHRHFGGLVDDVRLYARALDAAEVASLARGLRAAPPAMAGIAARPPEAMPVPAPAPKPAPEPPPAEVPADLASLVSGTRPARYAWDTLRKGLPLYVDRDYPYLEVASCAGLPVLRTACDDKKVAGDAVIAFDLKREATVLVGLENRVEKPSWMSGFTDTGESLSGRHKEGPRPYRLWARDFPPGRVALGGVNTGFAMYVVVLRPKGGAALVAGSTSAPAGLAKPEGTFHRAVNLNGPELAVDGNRWESGAEAENCLVFGRPVDGRDVPLVPAVDDVFARVVRTAVRVEGTGRIVLAGVPSGMYRVFLYVRDSTSPFAVALEGTPAGRDLTGGAAGEWRRLGPWEVEVKNGSLDVVVTGGPAHLCGIEMWTK